MGKPSPKSFRLETARPAKPAAAPEPSLLIGKSEAIRRVVRLAEKIARRDVTVLIEGESGTGKELVARLVHHHSPRAGRPFIFVNCAALSEQLVEAELFGHVRGAFTDARADKPGRFLLADGGTLFLDEIGDLPPKGQGDLLRVIEDGAFRMVGGTELVRVDVRVIAATNKVLADAVAAGKFREDLFYRLNIIPITIPPLREHAEDIPLLIEDFLGYFGAKHGRRRQRMSPAALRLCRRYSWPGNVRQLRNLIERLVVTCPERTLGTGCLPEFIRAPDAPVHAAIAVHPGMTLAEAEKRLIQQTLAHATSHREKAAAMLGISRRSLQYKLKRYGLAAGRADNRRRADG